MLTWKVYRAVLRPSGVYSGDWRSTEDLNRGENYSASRVVLGRRIVAARRVVIYVRRDSWADGESGVAATVTANPLAAPPSDREKALCSPFLVRIPASPGFRLALDPGEIPTGRTPTPAAVCPRSTLYSHVEFPRQQLRELVFMSLTLHAKISSLCVDPPAHTRNPHSQGVAPALHYYSPDLEDSLFPAVRRSTPFQHPGSGCHFLAFSARGYFASQYGD
ncbi:hypothetical protein C8R43DRAFT_963496 [Mycena crocata]|nr:hypothetical protein C8R43DRAFT_963496 [Mycena crocata]